jgi:hypothetical protein
MGARRKGRASFPGPAATRFPHLPAGLCDLEQLACGLSDGGSTPVSKLFERRCAEAFRALGFDVQERFDFHSVRVMDITDLTWAGNHPSTVQRLAGDSLMILTTEGLAEWRNWQTHRT